MKIVQIERSGSTQTSYWPTPVQVWRCLPSGIAIGRPDLLSCLSPDIPSPVRVVQIRQAGAVGTAGLFFAIVA